MGRPTLPSDNFRELDIEVEVFPRQRVVAVQRNALLRYGCYRDNE